MDEATENDITPTGLPLELQYVKLKAEMLVEGAVTKGHFKTLWKEAIKS